MLTIISGLIGFGTSLIPNLLNFGQDMLDKRHERAMVREQTEAQLKLGAIQLEAQTQQNRALRDLEASKAIWAAQNTRIKDQTITAHKAGRFVAGLSASVRPIVTYLFVAEYLLITWAIAYMHIAQEGFTVAILTEILDDRFLALLTMMITFWFGDRMMNKSKSK